MPSKFLAAISALALLTAGTVVHAAGSAGGPGTSSHGSSSKSSGKSGPGISTSQTSPLGGTAGQPSTFPGQPGRTMGQPTTGMRSGTTPQQPGIGAGPTPADQTNQTNQIPSPLRQGPQTTQQPQFLGSGGKAGDGSIPGGSLVALTVDERNRIREIILKQQVAQEARVNFKVMVGAKVPENVTLRPFPQEVLNIVPRYKDFDFVLADDRIVVVQRSTREIDTMIPFRS